jgi:glyoxylase I family protein
VLHLTEALADEQHGSDVNSTIDHVAFTSTDLPSAVARVTAHGVMFHIDDVPLTGQRQMFFKDPAGNGIELNFQLNSGDT